MPDTESLNGCSAPPASTSGTVSPEPLKVAIVGAGIAGLTAAAALKQAGHAVKISAAIHVGPNATRALQYLGYDPARLRGVQCSGMTMYNRQGDVLEDVPYNNMREDFGSPWYLAHRIDLHNELRALALSDIHGDINSKLHLSSKVSAIDADTGTIELATGEIHQADLIVGADGIHSVTRTAIFGASKPYHTGKACYRFIIDADDIYNDPECLPMNRGDGRCRIILSDDKRVVIYPCRNGELLNFVCMYPDSSADMTEGWNSASSPDALLDTFSDFGPQIVNCLKKAKNVKCWQMLQRTSIESWVKGRVCLIGDAAHPMLPHQGQGGGQAIEDGVSLGPLFKFGTISAQVPAILKLYQQVRHTRASTVEWLSRTNLAGEKGISPEVVHKYIFGHDVVEYGRHTRASELII